MGPAATLTPALSLQGRGRKSGPAFEVEAGSRKGLRRENDENPPWSEGIDESDPLAELVPLHRR